MHGIAELFRNGRTWIVFSRIRIIRLGPVGAPMTPVISSARVEHHDPLVAITVRDIDFVRRVVNDGERRAPEITCTVAAFGMARFANLPDEFSFAREFQHLRVVILIVAREPDVIIGVNENPMLATRPVIAGPFAAPRLKQIAGRIEFQHWRRWLAAFRSWRIYSGAFLIVR